MGRGSSSWPPRPGPGSARWGILSFRAFYIIKPESYIV